MRDDPFAGNEALKRIVTNLFETPDRAEWTPKTDHIALNDLREWIGSDDIEILGFAGSIIHNGRFRVEPPLPVEEYLAFFKRYFERCLRDDPKGKWSSSRYTAGHELVNIFGNLWRDEQVPRSVLEDLKNWLGGLYKAGDEAIRTCIVQATLEHLVEQKPIRKFFSDWQDDTVLRVAYQKGCLWPDGGGSTPLGKTSAP
jgi:hypothetical protein